MYRSLSCSNYSQQSTAVPQLRDVCIVVSNTLNPSILWRLSDVLITSHTNSAFYHLPGKITSTLCFRSERFISFITSNFLPFIQENEYSLLVHVDYF